MNKLLHFTSLLKEGASPSTKVTLIHLVCGCGGGGAGKLIPVGAGLVGKVSIVVGFGAGLGRVKRGRGWVC
ncbi:transmembrane protein, putative [Medicago truncatula]|uniref:Transmembrane protein, putative n=1 Tax=Medicago truncatula TaxID=3880 RepID=G7JZE8_MEDTR|nr:transmembrane protein, putative [Medicago truncatula]